MTAKKIAETKRAIENLSPPKTTMQVEGVKHKEWVVTMVDDAFEAKPIERAAKFMQEHEAVVNIANQDSLDSQENQIKHQKTLDLFMLFAAQKRK